MRDRLELTIEVGRLHPDDISENLAEFILHLMNMRDSAPEEYRNDLRMELEDDYEGGLGAIVVSYRRPETDEEVAERRNRRKMEKKAEMERARNLYEQLKKQFE